jgi:DNA-binding transcriptional LysR family regulator
VSGHILSLERSLSLRLFDRTGREIRLTKAGEMFLQYASKILTVRKDMLNALSEFSQGIRGELSLGASTIPGEYFLPKLMGDFKREHPRLTLSLRISDTKEIVQELLQGHIEFGLIGAKVDHPSLYYEKFEEDEIIVIAPSDHPLTRKRSVGFEDLLKEPWIVREEGSGTQMTVERVLRKKGKSLKDFNVAIEMGSTSSVKEGVKAKLGLAFVSRRAVEEELGRNLFTPITSEGLESISRQIYIVCQRRKTVSPAGMEFLRFLRKKRERTS